MDYYLEHGTRNLRIEPEKLVSRHREPDSLPLVYQHESASAYPVGGELEAYPHMPVVERERTRDGPLWLYRLLLEGIADPEKFFIETDFDEATPEEGWDEIRRVVFTRDPGHDWFAKGAQIVSDLTGLVLPGYEYLWIMDRAQRRHRANGYFEVSMVLKGMRGEKPFKRRISGSPQVVAPGVFEGATYFSAQDYIGWPPVEGEGVALYGSDLDIEWSIPQITVTDTFLTTTPPPTDKFPGFWSPEDPPAVFYLPVFGADYTYHIPWGWHIANLNSEQLAGKPCWLLSLTFGVQAATTPKPAPAA